MTEKKSLIKKADDFFRENIPKSRSKKAYVRHVELVRKYALMLGSKYSADLFTIEMAALLHDIGADAGKSHAIESTKMADEFLSNLKIESQIKARILSAIKSHSMSHGENDFKKEVALENQIIRDADTLSFLKDTYLPYFKGYLKKEALLEKAKQISLEKIKGMLNKVGTADGKVLAKTLYEKARIHILNY